MRWRLSHFFLISDDPPGSETPYFQATSLWTLPQDFRKARCAKEAQGSSFPLAWPSEYQCIRSKTTTHKVAEDKFEDRSVAFIRKS